MAAVAAEIMDGVVEGMEAVEVVDMEEGALHHPGMTVEVMEEEAEVTGMAVVEGGMEEEEEDGEEVVVVVAAVDMVEGTTEIIGSVIDTMIDGVVVVGNI